MLVNLIRSFSSLPSLSAFHQGRIADKIAKVVSNRLNIPCERFQESLATQMVPLLSEKPISPKEGLAIPLDVFVKALYKETMCHDVPHNYQVTVKLDPYRKDGKHFFLTETNQGTILRHHRIPLDEVEPL